jgi:Ca2+-binding RTX toxin-like protein
MPLGKQRKTSSWGLPLAKITAAAALDMTAFDFSNLYYGDSYGRGTTTYRVYYATGYVEEFRGSGFTYSGSTGEPTGGVVHSYAAFDGQKLFSVDGLNIAVTQIVKAAKTFSTSDDIALIRAALAGADTITGSSYSDNLTGHGGNDTISGGAGNDILNGGTGADNMRGQAGNDVYYVDNAGDIVNEALAGSNGTDKVISSISFNLANTARVTGAVENLTLAGTAAISGTGNALGNSIVGNSAANVLNGGAGNDSINGAAGNDSIYGGLGKDTLAGGAGNDRFVFHTALNATTNIDRITDFNVLNDTIVLENAIFKALGANTGTLNSAMFWKNTSGAAHDSNDRIIYETDTGKLFYDSNGNAAGGSIHFATLSAGLALTYADFSVI